MPRVKLSRSKKVLVFAVQFYVVLLFVLIVVRFLKLF